jgi:thioredoxin-dependent peroxiredoxin
MMTQLKPGDKAPDFTAQDQSGNSVQLSDLKGQKVFIYFFSKAHTSG